MEIGKEFSGLIIGLCTALATFATIYAANWMKPRADRVQILETRQDLQQKEIAANREEIGVLKGKIETLTAKLEVAHSELDEFRKCPSATCPFRFSRG